MTRAWRVKQTAPLRNMIYNQHGDAVGMMFNTDLANRIASLCNELTVKAFESRVCMNALIKLAKHIREMEEDNVSTRAVE